MKNSIRYILALHASAAYLGMITGFGALVFTYFFFYLLANGSAISFLSECSLCQWGLTYLMFVLGPGAIAMAGYFYTRTRCIHL